MSDEEIDMLAGEWGSALVVLSYDFNGNPTYGRTFTVQRFRAAVRAALEKQRICESRLTAEQAVMRQWIAEALPVLDTICAESLEESNLLAALRESGRRLVDGGPDDLLAGVE